MKALPPLTDIEESVVSEVKDALAGGRRPNYAAIARKVEVRRKDVHRIRLRLWSMGAWPDRTWTPTQNPVRRADP